MQMHNKRTTLILKHIEIRMHQLYCNAVTNPEINTLLHNINNTFTLEYLSFLCSLIRLLWLIKFCNYHLSVITFQLHLTPNILAAGYMST